MKGLTPFSPSLLPKFLFSSCRRFHKLHHQIEDSFATLQTKSICPSYPTCYIVNAYTEPSTLVIRKSHLCVVLIQ
ncbi:hypothetical protein L1987_06044 [Smallanthus sonchifolius]|uniref:Uncharacterized protein n=1 Tax=Smallanthus sonchifolius TaxID=185202 RepID=A0ACB9JX04_9ASTR|nr:hypothetical protein L1987_06044 [Smallanthus sonchifolius]